MTARRVLWAAGLIAAATTLLAGCSAFGQASAPGAPKTHATLPAFLPSATVGRDRILPADVDLRARLLALLDPTVAVDRAVTKNTANTALGQLVDESLVLQANPKSAPAVDVNQEMAALTPYLSQYYGSTSGVAKREKALGLTTAQVRAFVRVQVAYSLALAKYLPSVTQAQVAAYYKANAAQYRLTAPEVHARHILVKTQAQAQAILHQLEHGASFAALAQKDSLDPGSATKGGDLGWFTAGQMVAPFSKAAFSTPVGQYAIAHSQYGWHVIQVLGREAAGTIPPLAQIYSQVQSAAQQAENQANFTKTIAALRRRIPVRVHSGGGK
jgi:peptidyl-prolyl cis-trans isomerase C